MRALVILSIALVSTAAPAQAADAAGTAGEGDAVQVSMWGGGLCALLDDEDPDTPCPLETCILPNETFPDVPDEVLPVEVNASQCLEVVIETVEKLLPVTLQAAVVGAG